MKENKHSEKTNAKIISNAKIQPNFFENQILDFVTKGLILSLPLVIIIFLISLIFKLILSIISPISNLIITGKEEPGLFIHIITLTILFVFFYIIGTFISSKRGVYYANRIEREYFMRIPLYSTIRELIQQFTGVKDMPFSRVALIDPYNNGVLMTAFISDDYEKKIYTVFVPTAPNPMNGNIYHVPSDKLKFLAVSPETAMRTIVGMGTGASALFFEDEINETEEIPLPPKPTIQ